MRRECHRFVGSAAIVAAAAAFWYIDCSRPDIKLHPRTLQDRTALQGLPTPDSSKHVITKHHKACCAFSVHSLNTHCAATLSTFCLGCSIQRSVMLCRQFAEIISFMVLYHEVTTTCTKFCYNEFVTNIYFVTLWTLTFDLERTVVLYMCDLDLFVFRKAIWQTCERITVHIIKLVSHYDVTC